MDLSKIKSSNAELKIKEPATGAFSGLTITLLPDDSKELMALQRRWQTELLKTRGKHLTADKVEARTLERQVVATAGWNWGKDDDGVECTLNGEKPEFTTQNVRDLYKEHSWIRNQIAETLTDESEFFRRAN